LGLESKHPPDVLIANIEDYRKGHSEGA